MFHSSLHQSRRTREALQFISTGKEANSTNKKTFCKEDFPLSCNFWSTNYEQGSRKGEEEGSVGWSVLREESTDED